MPSPSPIVVAWSVVRSLRRIEAPRPAGQERAPHGLLANALNVLAAGQTGALTTADPLLAEYLENMASVIPDALTRGEAKAFWLNLYNAGALRLAASALARGEDSVLRLPGGFRSAFITIDGVSLSLDDVEHAKVRRFQDPRVHAALVCGSVSCPTLRGEPFEGGHVDEQLDDQMRLFLRTGGAVADAASGGIRLSRVFSWFGADFVRPGRMPTFIPSRSRRIVAALEPWMEPDLVALSQSGASVSYQSYDWGLRCTVA